MSKFIKRVQKCSQTTGNALVVGTAFGNLEEILKIYNTVFVVSPTPPSLRARNLVYRQEFNNLNQLTEINTIFLDLDTVDRLSELTMLWQGNKSVIIIEGDEVIGRDKSVPLYNTQWGCTSTQGFFHVWEKIK